MRRSISGTVVAALVAVMTVPLLAVPASAASYRFWSYWQGSASGWSFAHVGPDGQRPADGSVEGWRFSVSPDAQAAAKPRYDAASAFSTICKNTPAQAGKKRVALVVDFGDAQDAVRGDTPPKQPVRGSCVVADPRDNGRAILVKAGYAIRGTGLICALSGYPSHGCGELVADPEPTQTSAPNPTKIPSATQKPTTGSGAAAAAGAPDAAARAKQSTAPTTSAPTATPTPSSTRPSATTPSPSPSASEGPDLRLADGPPTDQTNPTNSTPIATLAILALILALGAAAVVQARRRR